MLLIKGFHNYNDHKSFTWRVSRASSLHYIKKSVSNMSAWGRLCKYWPTCCARRSAILHTAGVAMVPWNAVEHCTIHAHTSSTKKITGCHPLLLHRIAVTNIPQINVRLPASCSSHDTGSTSSAAARSRTEQRRWRWRGSASDLRYRLWHFAKSGKSPA